MSGRAADAQHDAGEVTGVLSTQREKLHSEPKYTWTTVLVPECHPAAAVFHAMSSTGFANRGTGFKF